MREHVGKALQSVQLTRKDDGARLGDNTELIGQEAIGRRSLALPATNSWEEVEVDNSETTAQKLVTEQQEQLVKKQDEDTWDKETAALAGGNKRQREHTAAPYVRDRGPRPMGSSWLDTLF